MTSSASDRRSAPASAPEPIKVTDHPVSGAGNGVYQVTVKIDDRESGSSVVRTLPPRFAHQSE